MLEAEARRLVHWTFTGVYRRQVRSTILPERLNTVSKCPTAVVGISASSAGLLRLVDTVLAEQDDVRVQNGPAPRGCLQRRWAHLTVWLST